MRMRTWHWLVASFCSWLLLGPFAGAATNRAITRTGPWGDYEAFPDICKLADGSVFVVFYGGTGHITFPSETSPRGGAVYGLRSTDSGKTWSAPILVADTPEDDRDPHLCQTRDGSLLATFFTYKPYKGPGPWAEDGDVFVVRSVDGGLTWGPPERLPTTYKDQDNLAGVFESGSPVALKDDHVILPLYVEKTRGHYVTVMIHSKDGGKTWGDAVEVDTEQSLTFSYGFCEAAVARVSDGRLITLMRPGMHQAYSSDEGYTWTKATKLPVTGDAPGVLLTSSKLLVATFRYRGTSAMISTNDGASWGRPWQIDTVGGAYSNQVELADGAILCVYYEEGAASSIRVAVFSVEPGIALADLDERWPVPTAPAVPVVGTAIDLRALNGAGKLKITTDMQLRDDAVCPGGQPEAAFDGSTEHMRSAWKAGADALPATYQLELDKEYSLATLGLCLKAGWNGADYAESAQVFLSTNGADWGEPVVTIEDAKTNEVRYFAVSPARPARFVKVVITKADGWPGLNELQLFAQ
jgi:hypothetical protein